MHVGITLVKGMSILCLGKKYIMVCVKILSN